jgi:ABC-type sugar transport system substrate-binding protein
MSHNQATTQTGRPNLRVGCIHRQIIFPYWAAAAQGVNAHAAELGLELCLPRADPDEECEAAVNDVLQQQPSVVILPYSVIYVFPEAYRPFNLAGIPVIGTDIEPSEQYASVVLADEAQGAATVVTYLLSAWATTVRSPISAAPA